jgi:aminoglycoside phosphotransferase (APT) family kinase protein
MMDFAQAYSFDEFRRSIFYPKTDVASYASLCATLNQTRTTDAQTYLELAQKIATRRWKKYDAIEPLTGGGTFHLLYRVLVDSNYYVIRLNRLSDRMVAGEFVVDEWLLPLLHARHIAAPIFVCADITREFCFFDYEILSYIQGNPLSTYEDPETQHMNPELLRAIGAYVASVHNVCIDGYGPIATASLLLGTGVRGVHERWADYINTRLQEHIAVCENSGVLDASCGDKILHVFAQQQQLLDNAQSSLLHGDLGNHNFISADGKTIAGVIDWEDCMAGDPVFDIAFWGTFFRDHMREDFLKGYATIRTLPVDFEQRYWLYYLRIALSKTVHRYYFGYKDRPGRPPASERILKALKNF